MAMLLPVPTTATPALPNVAMAPALAGEGKGLGETRAQGDEAGVGVGEPAARVAARATCAPAGGAVTTKAVAPHATNAATAIPTPMADLAVLPPVALMAVGAPA